MILTMKKPTTLKEEIYSKNNRDLALRMALHCVRNTIIENYHAQGKISDKEMKALNIEVVNKVYTFLELFTNPKYKNERDLAFYGENPSYYLPHGWDTPKIDKHRIEAIHLILIGDVAKSKVVKKYFAKVDRNSRKN